MQRVERTIVCPLVSTAAYTLQITIYRIWIILEDERWYYNDTTSRKQFFIYSLYFLIGAQPSKIPGIKWTDTYSQIFTFMCYYGFKTRVICLIKSLYQAIIHRSVIVRHRRIKKKITTVSLYKCSKITLSLTIFFFFTKLLAYLIHTLGTEYTSVIELIIQGTKF